MDGVNLFGETILFGGFINGVSIKDLDEIFALQFTGLQDKNGKDVFEGDIVSIQSGENEYDLSSVVFRHGSFRMSGLEMCMYAASELKVIGNIYDDPELKVPLI